MKKVKTKYNLYAVCFIYSHLFEIPFVTLGKFFLTLLLKRKCSDQRTSPNSPPNFATISILFCCTVPFGVDDDKHPDLATRNENTSFACEWVKLLSSSFGFKP